MCILIVWRIVNIYIPGVYFCSISEILEKVRCVSNPPFRPAVEVPIRLNDMKLLMENCWAENPRDRPTAQAAKAAIRKIAL